MMAWVMQSAMIESLQRAAYDRNDQVAYGALMGLSTFICKFVTM